jgi:sulfide:quinone oxidoreductase
MTAVLEERDRDASVRPARERFHVVIAGAGPAGVEAALRLHRIARPRVRLTIVAPEPRFLHLPPATAAPFAVRLTDRPPLKDRLAPVVLFRGAVASVSPSERELRLQDDGRIGYDALLVAVGGRPRSPFRRAIAYGMPGSEERMHGLIQDLEDGYVKRVAFVVPPGSTWPLPLYELALMTAERAFDMCARVELTLVTPEQRVLERLGIATSDQVAGSLRAAGITLRAGSQALMVGSAALDLRPSGERLEVDRVVTLPVLDGPSLDGLPHDDFGFLTVDRHGRVLGVPGVYAAGDATDFAVKQGGIACQQAEVAVDTILSDMGFETDARPFAPVLRGAVLTGCGARSFEHEMALQGTPHSAWPAGSATKFAGRELSQLVGDAGPRR